MQEVNPYDFIWQLSLAAACIWFKSVSGVRNDYESRSQEAGKDGSVRGITADELIQRRVLVRRERDRGAAMRDNEYGKIIDLQSYRNRLLMREWAITSGFGLRSDEVK